VRGRAPRARARLYAGGGILSVRDRGPGRHYRRGQGLDRAAHAAGRDRGRGGQWYAAVVDYPINIGGRPLHSWPAFIPATFEITILGAAVAAVLAMLVLNGLPRLHHPLFEVEEFELASRNRFFLCLPARDPVFAPGPARDLLEGLHPLLLREVPA
jgi:hypothetical protein